MSGVGCDPDRLVHEIQARSISYFLTLASLGNRLTPDRTNADAPVSIAAVGFSLAVYAIAAERGAVSRADAAGLALSALRPMAAGSQGDGDGAIGTHGLFYHFLDRSTARRTWNSEVSLIDTALFMAGAIVASTYFDADLLVERELRDIAGHLYRSAEWTWALDGGRIIKHGWKPECGFLHYGWSGYSEAMLLYILALASPTHPVDPRCYRTWTASYQWERIYGIDHLYAAPLFTHLFSQAWIDFSGIADDFMRSKDCDYAENTRRAVRVQHAYAKRNPYGHDGFGEHCWGLSAGPGPRGSDAATGNAKFLGYAARGVPYGPDDGTISPAAVAASLPFAPALVRGTLGHLIDRHPSLILPLGLSSGFNPSVARADGEPWLSQDAFGIDQGAIALLIENHLSGLPWSLLRRSSFVRAGLRRAGFVGGWLEGRPRD